MAQRVYSWWGNAMTAFAMLLFGAAPVIATRNVIVFAVCLAGFGYLAVRAVRMGVYLDQSQVIARSLVGTKRFPREWIAGTGIYTGQGSWGRSHYGAALLVDIPLEGRRTYGLWFLAATRKEGAKRWADRVLALVTES